MWTCLMLSVGIVTTTNSDPRFMDQENENIEFSFSFTVCSKMC